MKTVHIDQIEVATNADNGVVTVTLFTPMKRRHFSKPVCKFDNSIYVMLQLAQDFGYTVTKN